MKRIIFVMFGFLGNVFAGEDYFGDGFVYKEVLGVLQECGVKELSLCMKERALRCIDDLPNDVDLGNGLKIKSGQPDRIARHAPATSLPDEPRAREDALDNLLLGRVSDFMKSHTFEFKVPNETLNALDKSVEEGRKKKGGGMRIRSILMILVVKAAALGTIALKFIGLVAFKALVVAKIAFTISSIIALKKLVQTNHHTSTYEVVAHPHYDEHSHLDRSFKHDLPTKIYTGGRSII